MNDKLPIEKPKKNPYTTPQLTVYGDVEQLTRGGISTNGGTDQDSTPFGGKPVKKAPGTVTPTRKP